MGLLNNIFKSVVGTIEEQMREYYGIRNPYDAVEVVGRILRTDNSDKQRHLRNIIGWLKHLSASNKKGADAAVEALRQIKERWGDDVPV